MIDIMTCVMHIFPPSVDLLVAHLMANFDDNDIPTNKLAHSTPILYKAASLASKEKDCILSDLTVAS